LIPFSAGVASTVSSPPDDGPGPVDEGPGPSRDGVESGGWSCGKDCFWGEGIVGRRETRVKELLDDAGLGRAKGLAMEGDELGIDRMVGGERRDVEVIVMSRIRSG
jgi:hypothetical protein